MTSEKGQPNRLIDEKSPYLLQHVYNPVEWYPWGDEAFDKAVKENKPIFLSIGYSTCHWCHVMEHESFEDEEVAKLMNETFVSIKVDREERPDIDKVYMEVAMVLSGRGGWPLTIIMTPEKKPFVAATYIPKQDRYGQRGMMSLIPVIDQLWKNEREKVEMTVEQVHGSLISTSLTESSGTVDEATILRTFSEFSKRFDDKYGGFNIAPKFPSPHNLLFLLRYWKKADDPWALHMVEKTLQEMRKGGIFDQIGFGFHRYSTDQEWLLPHFEKMLYDQAMIMLAYTELYQVTGKKEYADVVLEIHEYLIRDLTSNEGGFYSAEDADSEGVEGKFYVWSYDEIFSNLEKEDVDFFTKIFNITKEGNFQDEATGEDTGLNILYLQETISMIGQTLNMDENRVRERIQSIRQNLLMIRERRIRPHLDDKILTDWNSLMIVALAKASQVLDNSILLTSAQHALDFILDNMLVNGELYHRYREGEVAVPAFHDDYAFLIWALLEMYETTFETRLLKLAKNITDLMLIRFEDEESGGFYFSGEKNEELLVRKKDAYDGAIPSGNSIAAFNLIRLSRILGEVKYEEKATQTIMAFAEVIDKAPTGFSMLLSALDYQVGKSFEVVIAGEIDDHDTQVMLKKLRSMYQPNMVVLLRTNDTKLDLDEIAPYTKYYNLVNNKTTAHVCIDYNCKLPTNDLNQMVSNLEEGASKVN